MAKNTKTLLIGCGGSGITTLTRLNELMASNSEFREDMAENIAYFVLDTSGGDLENFDRTIRFQMGSTTPPVVKVAHITEGYSQLNEMVHANFDRIKDPEVLAMMKKYWWYSPDGKPFRGEDITDLQDGAGQCCQVSYLAAWNYMPQIETSIASLLQELKRQDKNNRLQNLKVYIVAGLAGGTGRGSWTLVAFKVRQCLLRQGVEVPIDGVFFDATCYPNVTDDEQQAKSMYVNSATALSELTSWIRLKKDPASELAENFFSLPSLANPRIDRSTDVINLSAFDTSDKNKIAPVQSAYVVFGDNGGTAHLVDNKQYHDMAAAALYTMIVHREVAQKKSNMRSSIGSFASTTFEVDSCHIQTYLETAVQKAYLEKQIAEADEALIQKVKASVGAVESPDKDSFLGRKHLWVSSKPKFDASYSSLNDENSLLQAMMKSFSAKIKELESVEVERNGKKFKEIDLTSTLSTALAGQNVEEVTNTVESALTLEDVLNDNKIRNHFNQILEAGKLDGSNLRETLRDLVMDQFAPEGEALSLRRAMLFTDELISAFSTYRNSLTSEVMVGDTPYTSAAAIITAFKEDVTTKSGKTLKEKLSLIANPFNKDEIEELCAKFQYFAHAAIFFRIRETLAAFFKEAVEVLGSIRNSLTLMGELFDKASGKLDGNLTPVFRDKSFDDIFDDLFTDSEKPEAIQSSVPQADDLSLLYCRKLKPIVSRADLREKLTSEKNFYAAANPIRNRIREELDNLLDIAGKVKGRKYDTDDDARYAVPGKIAEVVMANVGLKVDNSKKSFIDREFSFNQVLRDNIREWNRFLSETSQGALGAWFDRFREYLGLAKSDFVEDANGRKTRINEAVVKKAMILSLLKNCDPWIEIDPDPEGGVNKLSLTCLVLLPFETFDKNDKEDVIKEIKDFYKDIYNVSLEIMCLEDDPGQSIPSDRILVYTSELLGVDEEEIDYAPVERIRSLENWSRYPKLLEDAEDLNHDSAALFKYFESSRTWREKPRSFAYLAPFFTMDPFRKLRWHPWIKEDVDREKAQLAEVYKVLFYALLGHKDGESEQEAENAREVVADIGIHLPLLNMGRKDKQAQAFYFLRDPFEWRNGKVEEPSLRAWRTGIVLENSINRVVEFLNEEGRYGDRAEGGKRLAESQAEGKRIRLALLAEAEAFFELANVPRRLGDEKYKAMVRDCCKWLGRKVEKSDAADAKYWKELLAFAEAERDKQG